MTPDKKTPEEPSALNLIERVIEAEVTAGVTRGQLAACRIIIRRLVEAAKVLDTTGTVYNGQVYLKVGAWSSINALRSTIITNGNNMLDLLKDVPEPTKTDQVQKSAPKATD